MARPGPAVNLELPAIRSRWFRNAGDDTTGFEPRQAKRPRMGSKRRPAKAAGQREAPRAGLRRATVGKRDDVRAIVPAVNGRAEYRLRRKRP
jgi:hypothetical protein